MAGDSTERTPRDFAMMELSGSRAMDGEETFKTLRVLGLTGPIACGKTTVGDTLLQLGAVERIDADRVVHELMAAGTPTTERIAQTFGREVVAPDGSVDRGALATIVFSDAARLRSLEEITHPAVRREIRRRIEALRGTSGVVVVDAVKLLQSDLLPLCDAVWVVRCSDEVSRRRLAEIRGMPPEQAAGRIAAQPSFDHPAVTAVIDNSRSRDDLRRQVTGCWQNLIASLQPAQPAWAYMPIDEK